MEQFARPPPLTSSRSILTCRGMPSFDTAQDHYRVLGVTRWATQDEICKAFRMAAFDAHPDRGGDEGRMRELNAAREVLGHVEARAAYDAACDAEVLRSFFPPPVPPPAPSPSVWWVAPGTSSSPPWRSDTVAIPAPSVDLTPHGFGDRLQRLWGPLARTSPGWAFLLGAADLYVSSR
jgi:hypothetical protein